MTSTTHPLVSILISNYNYARYLSGAIDSAIAQTYPHQEIIVVDDGSEDDSAKVIAGYGSKIEAIYQENGGQASAINAGFAASRGEIICLLDADDLWHPEKITRVVDAFQGNPKATVVYHRVQNVDTSLTPIGKPWPPYKAIARNIIREISQTGGWWPFPPTSALSFSRAFLERVMEIPPADYRLCADAYLADLAPWFGEVVGIDPVLSQMRIHNSNNWSHQDNQWQQEVKQDRIRVAWVNTILKQQEKKLVVQLSDRLPYQWLQYKLGKKDNLWQLSRLAWQNPWEHRWTSKVKTLSMLWLENFGIGSSRI